VNTENERAKLARRVGYLDGRAGRPRTEHDPGPVRNAYLGGYRNGALARENDRKGVVEHG
jgi:hypothetical protein